MGLSCFRAISGLGMGWVWDGLDLCAGLLYEHRFAMLITAFIVHNSVFSRFLDINMSKVVTKYVEGRVMGTSSRFFKDWPITIIA